MKETHKFTLKYSFDGSENYSPIDITFEIPGGSSIDQMLFNFECFLKACGFIFDGSFVQSHPEDKYEGCMADWDEEDDGPSYHDTLSTSICEDYKLKKLKEWNEGLAKLEAELKAKRDKDMEAYKEAIKEAEDKYPVSILYKKIGTLNSEAEKEVKKNNWVHGMCNPPSPDWKKK